MCSPENEGDPIKQNTMELICPNCNKTIESDNINITTDLAKCQHCGRWRVQGKSITISEPSGANRTI